MTALMSLALQLREAALSTGADRIVVERPDGTWARYDAERGLLVRASGREVAVPAQEIRRQAWANKHEAAA